MAVATATITIGLELTLDGITYDFEEVTTVTNVEEVIPLGEKLVPTAAEIEIAKIGTTGVAGEIEDINFLILTNKDDTNACRVRMLKTGAEVYDVHLPPGKSFLLWTKEIEVDETGGAFAAWQDIDTVKAQFDSSDGFIQIFAAKKQ